MFRAWINTFRLARAGLVLAEYGARLVPPGVRIPLALRVAHAATLPIRLLTAPFRRRRTPGQHLGAALTRLGPSYIKLGQFLATRGDLIGPTLSRDLSYLQDRLPPFPQGEARRAVEQALGGRLEDHFAEFGPAIAAASIAQVHKATVIEKGTPQRVAVKILRPDIERRFQRDLDSFAFAARQIERFHEPARRLRPEAVVATLARTTQLEMDLRLEAAALSEMAENIVGDTGFRVPQVDWQRTAQRVLTVEWIEGIPIADHARLKAAGRDLNELGLIVLRTFLTHAMRDGFFHADMHPGNLLVDAEGRVVAVDFGIMGRLGPRERRFLAEILHGIITRDYRRAAEVHFWAGYVPPHHPVEVFAQALRAIGEPIHGKTAEEISMADLLGQLFAYTEVFDMRTRPELILLQKSMVVVEGVARALDPGLNLWIAAEPVAKDWMAQNLGVAGRLRELREGADLLGRSLANLPLLLQQAEETMVAVSSARRDGFPLDQDFIRRRSEERSKPNREKSLTPWIVVLILAVLLWTMRDVFGFLR